MEIDKERYKRNILLPEVGEEGQKKLAESRVLVVGAGGLGSPVSLYLAAAGVGTIGIADFDRVDVSNLQRQILYREQDIGKAKAELAAEQLQSRNHSVQVELYPEGITAENAEEFLTAGASHVIVTSYVFCDGKIQMDRLKKLRNAVGKEHLVLDLSCRKKDGKYYIVTDRWQRFTEQMITEDLLEQLAGYCDEFLVHAVDVEGKASGIEEELVRLLGSWGKIPVTYAGGVGDFEDLARLKKLGKNMLNVTIGSALDLFGGTMSYEKVKEFCRE